MFESNRELFSDSLVPSLTFVAHLLAVLTTSEVSAVVLCKWYCLVYPLTPSQTLVFIKDVVNYSSRENCRGVGGFPWGET